MTIMTPEQLKSLRARLGWSQARLAQELGVHTQTVAHWEQGRYPISSLVARVLKTLHR